MLEPDKELELAEELEALWFNEDWEVVVEPVSLELLEPKFVVALEPKWFKELECEYKLDFEDDPEVELECDKKEEPWLVEPPWFRELECDDELEALLEAPWTNEEWEAALDLESLELLEPKFVEEFEEPKLECLKELECEEELECEDEPEAETECDKEEEPWPIAPPCFSELECADKPEALELLEPKLEEEPDA